MVAERRMVTVLFVDLVGFTPYSERHDAEDVREMLAEYFELARAAIARHHGVVDKLMGDGVMAVWGAQVVREDDAERAVRAALEIVRGVGEIAPGLAARAGVNTGEAAVDMSGQDTGMVIGDLVNTAARLESAAEPGTVLVGAATYRLANGRVEFVDGGQRRLKGKGDDVPTWVALGTSTMVAHQPLTPLVGRGAELQALEGCLGRGTDGARLVWVAGQPGVGKSRLVSEFLRMPHGGSSMTGSCSDGTAMEPFVEMLRTSIGIDASCERSAARRAAQQMLATCLQDDRERKWVEPAVLRLLGLDVSADPLPELFARFRLLLERLAEHVPLLLVVDDAHRADETTLDFVEHLCQWVRRQPLVLVLVGRPEMVTRRVAWSRVDVRTSGVELEALPPGDIRQMVEGLVPALPQRMTDAIVARSEGVPLYATEMIRMLAVEGVLRWRLDHFDVERDADSIVIPESLTALASARLDALPPHARRAALDASVLGDRFDDAALGAVCALDPHDRADAISTLLDQGICVRDTEPGSIPRLRFSQSLLRETAYKILARADRRLRHGAAARHFESIAPAALSAAIAAHDLAAYELESSPPSAEAASRAVRSLRAAVEPAWQLGGFSEVVRLCRSALPLSTSELQSADLQEWCADALVELGQYSEALTLLETSRAFRERQDDLVGVTRALRSEVETLIRLGRPRVARSLLERTIPRVRGRLAPEVLAPLDVLLSRTMDFEGDSALGFQLAERVASASARRGDAASECDALVAKGTCCARLGLVDEGSAALSSGIEIAEAIGAHPVRLRGMTNLAWLLWDHRPIEAYRLMVEGCGLTHRFGAASMHRLLLGFRLSLGIELGEWDDARAVVESVDLEQFEGVDLGEFLAGVIAFICCLGEDAAVHFERLASLTGVDRAYRDLWTGQAISAIETVRGDHQAAEAAAWSAADASIDFSPELMARAVRASLWAGHPARALAGLERIDGPMRNVPRFGPVVDGLVAAARSMSGDGDRGIDAALRARDELLRLGLRWPAALAAIDAAVTWGVDDPRVARARADARSFLVAVGSQPYVEILDSACR